MPNLSDYIGQLMAEITRARVQADVEAVRLADYYANHPLLKVFPVPRFRLPTVTLDFPVAIGEREPSRTRKPLDLPRARKAYSDALAGELRESSAKLSAAEERRVLAVARKHLDAMCVTETVSASTVSVADEVTRAVADALPPHAFEAEPERAAFVQRLRDRTRLALLASLPEPVHVQVVTNTADLRELGPLETLTRIQLNITEQGLEWKGDGTPSGPRKLLPE